jgi:hypothetical protein
MRIAHITCIIGPFFGVLHAETRGAKPQEIMRIIRYRSNLHGSCVKAKLHLQLHAGVLRSGGDIHEGPFYPRLLGLPSFLMLSPQSTAYGHP